MAMKSNKKAASAAKRTATKAKRAGKKVAKVAKKATKVVKKATKVVKSKVKHAEATTGTIRGKAKRLIGKLQHAQHDAASVARRVGTTMETIGGAIMSLVEGDDGAAAHDHQH